MKKLKFLVPLLLIIFAACEEEKPDGVMAEDTYIAVFAELLVVDQIDDNQLGPVNRQHLVDEIYEKYNVTEEEFRESHNYYQQQPESQVERVDRIEEFISSDRDSIQSSLREYQDEQVRKDRARTDSLDALGQDNEESDN